MKRDDAADREIGLLVQRELCGGGEGLVAVDRFGSTERGEERADSDIDLAFLAERSLDPVAVYDAAQRIAARLGEDVDLIDLARASTVMRAQVVARGRRSFAVVESAAARFEMRALSDYARPNEERACVIRAFEEPYRDG